MTPTLSQMRGLVAISKYGTFTRAARALNLSQPALTVQMRQLEALLDVKVLDRDTRSVHVTVVGQEFVEAFERILGELDAVTMGARELASKSRGLVRVACLPSFAATELPRAIAAFRQQHPGIQFVVRDGVGRKIVSLVKAGAVDFGIAAGDTDDPELMTNPLFQDRIHAIYASPHALDQRRRITAEILARFPLIMMDEDSTVREVVDAGFVASGLSVKPAIEATYMSTALGMARAKLGVALLPSTAVEATSREQMQSRPVEGLAFQRSIFAVRRRGHTMPPASVSFLADLLGESSHAERHRR